MHMLLGCLMEKNYMVLRFILSLSEEDDSLIIWLMYIVVVKNYCILLVVHIVQMPEKRSCPCNREKAYFSS